MTDHKTVFEGEKFVIADIVKKLPRHSRYPYGTDIINPNGKRAVKGAYTTSPGRAIEKIYYHQTYGAYAPGIKGVRNTAHFFIADPVYDENSKRKGGGRGWPGFAYTWYVCYEPEVVNGKYVIYQCNDLGTISWHTKGCNMKGAGIAFQGMFRSRHIKNFKPFKNTNGEPSEAQMICADAFWEEYAKEELGLTNRDISGHFEVGKKACPGDTLEHFVQFKQRNEDVTEFFQPAEVHSDLIPLDDWESRQAALVVLGHDLGKYGNKKNGVDGKPGEKTRLAIEAQEEIMGLKPDGQWDDRFENLLKLYLHARGITQEQINALS